MANIQTHLIQILFSVLGIVIIAAGVGLAATAKKAKYSETARISFNIFAAITICAIGGGAIAFAVFGKTVLSALGFI